MQKLIISIFLVLTIKPLSAQIGSGFIKCNYDFIASSMSLDTSNLDAQTFKNKYNENLKELNSCIQNYKAPEFLAKTSSNDSFILNKIDNQVIILNFWSINCPPCLVELRILNSLSEYYKNKNVVFVSLSLNTKEQIANRLTSNVINIPNASAIFDLYGILGYPQTFIIKKNHIMKYQFIGLNMNDIDEFKKLIKVKIDEALID